MQYSKYKTFNKVPWYRFRACVKSYLLNITHIVILCYDLFCMHQMTDIATAAAFHYSQCGDPKKALNSLLVSQN